MNPTQRTEPSPPTHRGSSGAVVIGLIDGPVDASHPELAAAHLRSTAGPMPTCARPSSPACRHGTFVASQVVRLCPAAQVVVHPIFCEDEELGRCPLVRPSHLAQAIEQLVDRGARIINMSVGLSGGPPGSMTALRRAYRRAEREGVLLVAAAGNEGQLDANPLFRDRWVIPVAAHDGEGRILPSSNHGGWVARQGLMAPGHERLGAAAGGGQARMSGTSVAAPQVSAAAARLWALRPDATADEIRRALLRPQARRDGPSPPPLDVAESSRWLVAGAARRPSFASPEPTRTTMTQHTAPSAPSRLGPSSAAASPGVVVPQACACSSGPAAGFVFSTGQLEVRPPTEGDRRELDTRARQLQVPSDDLYAVLSKYRYLARRMCWVLNVNERPTGVLVPRSESELSDLIAALAPDLRPNPEVVVTGTLGSQAPPSLCGGLEVPMVSLAELDYFTKDAMLAQIRKELGTQGASSSDIDQAVQRVWTLMGTWREPGFDDEQRAKNYLALRTTSLYEITVSLSSADGGRYWLQSISATATESEDGRSIVDVDSTFQDSSGRTQVYRAEVDVTDLFAFQSKALYAV